MIEACAALETVLHRWFSEREFISLTVQRERLYVDEFGIDSEAPLAVTLVDGMLDRLIRKVMIHRSATSAELQFLAEMFNMPPKELRDQGGPDYLLGEKGNSNNISIVELTDFFSEESFGPDSWQAKVKKAGLDVDEVSRFMIGPDRDCSGSFAQEKSQSALLAARLTRQEIAPLMELLLQPEFFSEIISDLAAPENSPADPGEVMRLVQKARNRLLLHSHESEKSVLDAVSKGIGKFDHDIRQGVLMACLDQRKRSLRPWSEKDFDFSPAEWATGLVQYSLANPPEQVRKYVRFSVSTFSEIKPYLAKALRNTPLRETASESFGNLGRIKIGKNRFGNKDSQAQQIIKSCKAILQDRETHQKLLQKRSTLPADVDAGYAAIMLALCKPAQNRHRVAQLLDSFFVQIESMIEKGDPNCRILFSKLIEMLKTDEMQSHEAMLTWIRKDGAGSIAALLPRLKNIDSEYNRETLTAVLPLVRFAGKECVETILQECYFDAIKTTPSAFSLLLENARKEFAVVLENYIDEGHEQFSPARFLRALDLYIRIAGSKSLEKLQNCLASRQCAVRVGTLLILGQCENKTTALALLRESAFPEGSSMETDERIAALYGLGLQEDTGSQERMRQIIEKEGKKNPDLRNAALYAYALLCQENQREEIAQLFKKTTRSGLRGLFSR